MKILIAESKGFSSAARARLECLGRVFCEDLDRSELIAAVPEVDVLWIRLRHHIDEQILEAAKRLKVIVTPTTGLNHLDLVAAERRGISILSLRGETTFLKEVRGTAEHTIGLLLALIRHLPQAYEHVGKGGWNRDKFWGSELYGKTAGIVGLGRLGTIVARYLEIFGMRVIATDPNTKQADVPAGITLVPLKDLLTTSDVVTLHVNLTSSSQGFFSRKQFLSMKHKGWFINTSRGELVDEVALLEALVSEYLSGAALDVLCNETQAGMSDYPLVQYAKSHNNLIITPHIGGCTAESIAKTELYLAEKLCALRPAGGLAS
jgi:D-3-phosphoglycerate dehydrogenase